MKSLKPSWILSRAAQRVRTLHLRYPTKRPERKVPLPTIHDLSTETPSYYSNLHCIMRRRIEGLVRGLHARASMSALQSSVAIVRASRETEMAEDCSQACIADVVPSMSRNQIFPCDLQLIRYCHTDLRPRLCC